MDVSLQIFSNIIYCWYFYRFPTKNEDGSLNYTEHEDTTATVIIIILGIFWIVNMYVLDTTIRKKRKKMIRNKERESKTYESVQHLFPTTFWK
mmetsp:Transcript_35701/g.32173  ORF Transcript_35701/g.32173 Transcript_35701/m.32173 type:complete len:93 (+) Transcript_35701:212-490(+)